jgi:uncharacterized protein YuzE
MKPIRSPAAHRWRGVAVKIEYSKQVDALYINLREVPVAESRDIEEGVTLDFDAKGHLVGLEILDASERMGLSNLVNVSIENLPLERVPLEAA